MTTGQTGMTQSGRFCRGLFFVADPDERSDFGSTFFGRPVPILREAKKVTNIKILRKYKRNNFTGDGVCDVK